MRMLDRGVISMPPIFRSRTGACIALGLTLLSGCQSTLGHKPAGSEDVAHFEGDNHLNGAQVADVQVALGHGFENRGEIEQAQATYTKAIEKDPNRSDAYVRLAVLHDQQGQFGESAKMYEKAFQLQPKDADTWNNHGYSLYLQQRWDEAERCFRRALLNWGRATLGTVPFVIWGGKLYGAEGVLAGNMVGGVAFGLIAIFAGYRSDRASWGKR
ncbi:tetratricopeptide repeat protein [Hyphomicrobium sp.]|uniref:tetratricopeptide repeat protein n=1 Tax=Hyphomicrobium sp. TaxID=82 RepID=UPI0039E49AAD